MSKIEVKNIYKIFGDHPERILPMVRDGATKEEVRDETDHTVGLDNVSLSIKEGEIFVCMGLSGSGKSTLIRHINRLIDPTSGEVTVDGVDVLKLNHNELLTYPNTFNQIMFGSVDEAWNLGAAAVGATIYFGSEDSNRQIVEVAQAFERAHELGMATILWCYLRNSDFKQNGIDYHVATDITAQANHLGVTIQADIIKQKLPENNGGYTAIGFGKTHDKVYSELSSDHPIDLCRYQVANCYMGRIGLINSGGASTGSGSSDLQQAVITAVINKRAGGHGLISGRKAFQKPMNDGVKLLNAIQDVYLDTSIDIA